MNALVFRARAAVDAAPLREMQRALLPAFEGRDPPPCFHNRTLLLIAAMHGVLDIACAFTVLLIKQGRDATPPRAEFLALWRALDHARHIPSDRRIAQ